MRNRLPARNTQLKLNFASFCKKRGRIPSKRRNLTTCTTCTHYRFKLTPSNVMHPMLELFRTTKAAVSIPQFALKWRVPPRVANAWHAHG